MNFNQGKHVENSGWKLTVITEKLEGCFGEPFRPERAPALDTLIETILSQNTSDHNRNLAFRRLKERFPDWDAVENAPVDAVEEAIRPAGLARQKAPRIKHILKWLRETRGALNLDFICKESPEEALTVLTKLKGVGVKTVYVVLLFSCGKDVFPVDTHIHRIARRVGLISEKTSAAQAHQLLGKWVPKGKAFSLHINLLKLGRTICKARQPKCDECPIREVCDHYQSIVNQFEDSH
ncbi:MAG: endonuclease III [Calditrichaeota bacterium]|nr:endonuclease III [Calditrichota bacterium]